MVCLRMVPMYAAAHNFLHIFQNFSFDGKILIFGCKVELSLNTNLVAHQAEVYPGFCSMKGYFYSPLDRMLGHRRATPSIKFAGTHLYTWPRLFMIKGWITLSTG